MGASVIGLMLGALLGAFWGTEVAIATGATVGMLTGLSVHLLLWIRDHTGDAPTLEQHRVLCVATGQTAECHFEGDLETGRWYDVKRCSLLDDPADVNCDKGCVRLMTLSGERPGKGCHCDKA